MLDDLVGSAPEEPTTAPPVEATLAIGSLR
jgi:hypothetical protein